MEEKRRNTQKRLCSEFTARAKSKPPLTHGKPVNHQRLRSRRPCFVLPRKQNTGEIWVTRLLPCPPSLERMVMASHFCSCCGPNIKIAALIFQSWRWKYERIEYLEVTKRPMKHWTVPDFKPSLLAASPALPYRLGLQQIFLYSYGLFWLRHCVAPLDGYWIIHTCWPPYSILIPLHLCFIFGVNIYALFGIKQK